MPVLLALMVAGALLLYFWRRADPELPRSASLAGNLDKLPLRSVADVLDDTAAANSDDPSETPIHAYALVRTDPDLDLAAIAAVLRRRFSVTSQPGETGGEQKLQRELLLPRTRVRLELVRGIHDEEVFAQALADPRLDAQARRAAETHQAVVVLSTTCELGELGRAIVQSQLLLALLETCPQLTAALWLPSTKLLSRKQLKKGLALNYEEALPVGLWVSARTWRTAQGAHQGATLGLTALGAVEFEALDAPESLDELRDRLEGLARYTLISCRTIFNGDTTGVDGFERIRLQKAPSETLHKGWVFQLRYLRPSPQSPWT